MLGPGHLWRVHRSHADIFEICACQAQDHPHSSCVNAIHVPLRPPMLLYTRTKPWEHTNMINPSSSSSSSSSKSHYMSTDSNSAGEVPGDPTHLSTSLMSATSLIQSFAPISRIHQHLCAFHLYADDTTRQVQAHHFCSHVNADVRQCLIFDSLEPGARLIGVEYIITEPLFLTLPDEEKPLWHSHEYEVKSGVLFLPGVPGIVERRDLEKVAKTYGKTFHFWQVDRGDELPLGVPSLMMALTRDGQLHEDLARGVEKKFGVSFEKERENRAYISGPEHGIHHLANGAGKRWKLELKEVNLPS
ncbi:oil body-associated protein 1A-like [Phalaenopsis equestris]|uniref:oil body-associated protein 1A-like n=1 Tax=Phalaenopsis equestris TaxID=78828 RepID=UPI0009E3209D|nr:oil body-associated protein 1A-like [Phalaenopsis equestris]